MDIYLTLAHSEADATFYDSDLENVRIHYTKYLSPLVGG